MSRTPLEAVGIVNSVIMPAVVIRPILFPSISVNQILPSGPATMPPGPDAAVGTGNSVTVPEGVIRPVLFAPCSVNQRSPPGTLQLRRRHPAFGVSTGKSPATPPAGDIR